ncbi:MAG TPA: branched-chain amino acid ABC transporter permease [Xanthobacteraceae bacterium]|nr:branched-chain amino acid ABC transporter permease [Xanthobacteraceae bacterium]
MSVNELIRLVFDASALGALLFLVSAGMSMIFGLMRIVNVAHGSFYLLGAYIAFGMLKVVDNQLLSYVVAIGVVTLFGAVLYSMLIERVATQPLRQILLTFGVVLVVGDIALFFWRGVPAALPVPDLLSGQFAIGRLTFPVYRLFVIGLGLAVAISLDIAQRKTRIGAMIRAGSDDLTMLACMGVNVRVLFVSVFAFGAALAALGGVLGGMFLGVYPGIDLDIVNLAFVVVIVGGLGSMRGAFAASLLIGLLDNITKAYVPELSLFAIYLLLVLVLAFRPTGLFAQRRIA